MEGQGRSRKVMEGYGWSFPITRLTFQVRKVRGGLGGWVACRIILSAPVPFPFLWTLDMGFGIWDYMSRLVIDNAKRKKDQ